MQPRQLSPDADLGSHADARRVGGESAYLDKRTLNVVVDGFAISHKQPLQKKYLGGLLRTQGRTRYICDILS